MSSSEPRPPDLGADAFGDAVRHVRRVHRVSQRRLAAWLGVPHSRVGRIESGDLSLSLHDAIGLFRVLGFRVVPSHDFPCRPQPVPEEARVAAEGPNRCAEWFLDGAITYRDDADRAFPAHGVIDPSAVPDHWGVRYGWGSTHGRMPWVQDRRGPRAPGAPECWAGQDGAMSATTPPPGGLSASTPQIRAAVEEYAARRPALEAATHRFIDLVRDLLDDAGINYLSVSGRTKSVESFAAKAERRRDGELVHPDPLEDITDVVGVRVITYVPDDVTAVAELLAEELAVLDDRDLGKETARSGRFGYASRHLLVGIDASRSVPRAYESLGRQNASVQVRTVLQHAWAEFEHDIRYKGSVPEEHASDLDRRFTLAAGLIELADREFSAIRGRLQKVLPTRPADTGERPAPGIAAQDLAKFLAHRYTDAGWSRADHYTWISGLLLELGVTTVDQLAEVLGPDDGADLTERMGYKYPPGAVRRLDDALLQRFGERYLDLDGNAHRRDSLAARLEKLRA
jgi:ppGpp synthetase/RelA/SpoT-type nucleotidyltranferase